MLRPMSLPGRMGKFLLSVGKPLLPVFEAVANSIQAIEDAKIPDGKIVIRIHRADTQQKDISDDLKGSKPVKGFTIEDNGVGFTEANYISFQTPDSLYKKNRGGKGIGRMYWLKAFTTVHVESTFHKDGKCYLRSFDFDLPGEGVHHDNLVECADSPSGTKVQLINYLPEYVCPKQYDTIARKIIEHFLTYFTMATCPSIVLTDAEENINRSLNDHFIKQMNLHTAKTDFTLGNNPFTLEHFCISTSAHNPEHHLHLCAVKRSVIERDLSTLLPDLHGPLADETSGKRFVYAGYVSGSLLEQTVSEGRTRFDLVEEEGIFQNTDESTLAALMKEAASHANTFLATHMAPFRDKKLTRIKAIIQKKPQFRFLLKQRPQWIDGIRANLSDDELELELYKLKKRFEIELQSEGKKLQSSLVGMEVQKRKQRLAQYMNDMNQLGIGKLAEYVVHRRAVLDFLSDCMKIGPDGKYTSEDLVHQVIFPRKLTSGDLSNSEESNLWIIDERLEYHSYLASDVAFESTVVGIDGENKKERADLLVVMPFDTPHAFADSVDYTSLTIVEFKKPMRDDYHPEKRKLNPVLQVLGYIRAIREKTKTDKDGQLIELDPNAPIYAYIICTITKKLKRILDEREFTVTPDGLGFFKYHQPFKAYIEVISYKKLLADAKKRNEVFFDKLNLPSPGVKAKQRFG